jgi:hypothetical protein
MLLEKEKCSVPTKSNVFLDMSQTTPVRYLI